MHEGLGRIDQKGIAGEADDRAAESGYGGIRHGSISARLEGLCSPREARPMRAMITASLIGTSVFLFIGFAQANPIDDCNQSDDAE